MRQSIAAAHSLAVSGRNAGVRILRERTEDLWLPPLNRLRVPIEQALRDARLKPSQIDSLVLVGGASQMPLVQRIAVRLFGKLPYQSYDPSTIVALGAAIQAACRLRSEDIEEVISPIFALTRWALKLTARAFPAFSRRLLNETPLCPCRV
ncbi:Hsp70 family protein [Escherichia coli]|nr:Hsp70 family protein [Escherichia coli]